MTPNERQIEELLESAYLSWEETGSLTPADFLQRCDSDQVPDPIGVLESLGLLTSSEDGCMRDYQLPRGELVYDTGSTARVARAVWLNDGQRMVTMPQWAPVLGLLSIDSFERKQIDPPVVGRLLAMDVSPDGSLLLAASTDGTTMLWRTTDFKLWASVRGHTGPVLFAAFNPDGSQFITTSTDGTARLWPTNPAAEARARRPQIVPLVAR